MPKITAEREYTRAASVAADRKGLIVLNYSAGHFTVEPKDEDQFVISAQKAVEACRQRHHSDRTIRAFKQNFILPLRDWCEANASRVRACYVPPPAGYLEVYVLGETQKYDFDLGRGLSDLELKLADAGWLVSVTQIPHCPNDSLRTHFNPDGAIEVYANHKSAPDEGGE